MVKYFFIILLITHVVCDFYLQSPEMAKNKKEKFLWLLRHICIYSISAITILTFVMPRLWWEYLLIFVVGHAGIDLAKYVICNCKYVNNTSFLKKEQIIFITDQILHLSVMTFIVYLTKDFRSDILYNVDLKNVLDSFELAETALLSWVIKILLIHKPANILIATVLSQYRPDKKGAFGRQDKNAGRFIGTLERLIMVILISFNQYSAVGLVLTAKSIARYDRISKDQEFAEYYLLGTLMSALCAVMAAVIF